MRALIALSVVLYAAVPAARQNPQHEHAAPEKLGRVHFATSCAPGVGAGFDRAVALLHSFSFSTARQAFEDVLAKDPSCAIAQWGIAMTYWGNPFAGLRPPKALEAGAAVIGRARATGKPTARERDYIAAVAEEFKNYETVDQRTRVLAYERAMEQLYRTYPQDREAAAFYALAVNQTALPSDKTYAQQLKAAAILEKLWAAQPDHPGLPHYLIHAYDHPALAPRALAAARSYAKIAPSAPHALHMPAHTFTRVGYWQESIDTNIASAGAAIRDGAFAEALHAMDYEVYAYLQTGQDAAASRMVEEAPRVLARLDPNAMGGAAPGVAGLYAAAAIPARYALERGAWSDAAALQPQATSFPYVDALTRFARAIGAARSGKPDAARADLAELGVLGERLEAVRDADWSQKVGIQQQIGTAWVTFAEGRKAEAVELLRKAADAEDATDKSAISPGPLAPARELLGEMLLTVDRPADALKEFEATMKKEPNRFRATYNAAKAASLAGDRAKARQYYRQLLDICKAGDTPGRPELEEARKFIRTSAAARNTSAPTALVPQDTSGSTGFSGQLFQW
jgi:tetratricopeptide (TPR) repeat protein